MRFPYRKINLENPFNSKKFILRPIIPLSIKYQDKTLRFEALIDSGADFNIFPMEIAEKLGLDGEEIDAIRAEKVAQLVKDMIPAIDTAEDTNPNAS